MRKIHGYLNHPVKFQINSHPRDGIDIPSVDVEPLTYLGQLAREKKFAASLLVNLYNSNIVGADMYALMGYIPGESSDLLKRGVFALLEISCHVECHEVYGEGYIKSLIDQYEFGANVD